CGPNQEREFPRFKTDGVAEEKIRIIRNPRRAHTLNHSFVKVLRSRSGFKCLYRLQHTCLNSIVSLAMLSRWLRTHAARFANIRVIAIDGATHVDAEDIALLQDLIF